MKQPWEWEEEDIEQLIRDGVQESLMLDYKRCAALDKRNPKSRSDLSKDVSAFANSVGGTLVYGVEEQNHLPIGIDPGFDPTDLTREWIEQIINSTIQRRIDGIRIKQIVLKNKNPGNVLYIVHVPQSNQAPHMAEDHIFYKRFNYQSIAMEEYEVRDVAQRSVSPELRLEFHLKSQGGPHIALQPGYSQDHFAAIPIDIYLMNDSPTPAEYIFIRLFIDGRLDISNIMPFDQAGGGYLPEGQHVQVLTLNWSIPHRLPVWQGLELPLMTPPLSVAIPRTNFDRYLLRWEIFSPKMVPRTGQYTLHTQATLVSLKDNGWQRDVWVKLDRNRSSP